MPNYPTQQSPSSPPTSLTRTPSASSVRIPSSSSTASAPSACEPVVKACVESDCDYLDICGESEFMERMEVVYGEKASESGSLVISACGFDSVPAELGFMFNVRQWSGEEVVN